MGLYLNALRRRWQVAVLAAAAVLAVMVPVTLGLPNVYRSSASLLVNQLPDPSLLQTASAWEVDDRLQAINGFEISPGYSELNDPDVQARHFHHQVGDKEEQQKVDEDFLTALKFGMPPAGGMGFGIDRFVTMLTGAESLRDIIMFPLMKPFRARFRSV